MIDEDLYWKALYKFLKQNNCLKEFIQNATTKRYFPVEITKNDSVIDKIKKCGTISAAFMWMETLEGVCFWKQMDINFEVFYNKIEKDYNRLKL